MRHHLRIAIEPLIWDLIPQVERGWRYDRQQKQILCRIEVRFLSVRVTWWAEAPTPPVTGGIPIPEDDMD